MKTLCVIPARYASERLRGKPLIKIAGSSLIKHVYDRVLQVDTFSEIVVATDDDRIYNHVKDFGGNVLMTRPDHKSGTERLLEVADRMPDFDLFVNVQGDEPLISPKLLHEICRKMEDEKEAVVYTSASTLDPDELGNPNVVKVVKGTNNRAYYFSRAPIPFARSGQWVEEYHLKHIGVYFFSKMALHEIKKLEPHPIEKYESLEQLRWLLNGIPIYVHLTDYKAIGVDTKEDLEKVRKLLES